MELLQKLEDRGFPSEYLLARIRGRRSRLIRQWRPLVLENALFESLSSGKYGRVGKEASPEGVWRDLMREYRWVYGQMIGQVRRVFSPFFLYSELRTVFICLRHARDVAAGRIDELLRVSLLSDEIKELLSTKADVRSVVAGIEKKFVSLSATFEGLSEAYDSGGLRAVEQKMMSAFLCHVSRAGLHPIMKAFFTRIIDSRNIMSLYKYLRLDAKTAPPFQKGGDIPEERFRAVIDQADPIAVTALIRDFSGISVEGPEPTQVELSLYRGITRFLKKAGREPFGAGPILDYLWSCSLEAMNLSVLFYGKDLERELVAAELVQ